MAFKIRYGLGGGFGGCELNDWEDCDAATLEEANEIAYSAACEEYEMYDGLHGLMTIEDFIEEDGLSEDEAEEAWREERESWIEYEVMEVKDEH